MEEQSYFMGQDGFIWWTGVVEDRNDPEQLGRVRVRCLGFHSEDLNLLPTTDLPWAHVMHPITDPSMHGLGNTPSFLVEGSWVVGFFRDAHEKQQPIIMGSLPGIPSDVADSRYGFNDPRSETTNQIQYKGRPTYGPYPSDELISGHGVGEPDTSKLARGAASEGHTSLINRRDQRLRGDPAGTAEAPDNTGVPTATKPHTPSVTDGSTAETRGFWEEPHPKSIVENADPYHSSQYPYNHVHESESGHIREIDDTPGGERLFTQHKSGTFEEIHPAGTKVVKVIGDNYEIIAGTSFVSISGSVNLTVEGTVRELIKGDYIQEIEGNFTQKVHKNHIVKVGAGSSGGNREEEIRGNHAQQINGNKRVRITGFSDTVIEESQLIIVNDKSTLSAVNDIASISQSGSAFISASTNLSLTTNSGITTIKSGDKLNIKSGAAMEVKSETTLSQTSTGVGTITLSGNGSQVTANNSDGTGITLTGHTHTDPAGVSGNETSVPND